MSVSGSTLFKTTKGYLKNNAAEMMRVAGLGPVVVVAQNQEGVDCIVNAYKISPAGVAGRAETSTTATAVADEATGWSGDAHTLAFTAQSLNNVPIVPKSVILHNDNAGELLCFDGGDGHFYTSDADEDECGTIDYFTGLMELHFPIGKAPAVGAIDGAYLYEDDALHHYGRKVFTFQNLNPAEILVIGGACAATDDSTPAKMVQSSLVHTDILVAGDATSFSGL